MWVVFDHEKCKCMYQEKGPSKKDVSNFILFHFEKIWPSKLSMYFMDGTLQTQYKIQYKIQCKIQYEIKAKYSIEYKYPYYYPIVLKPFFPW